MTHLETETRLDYDQHVRTPEEDAELRSYGVKPENHPKWMTLEWLLKDRPWLREHRVYGR